jgi:hypothetical protein
VRQRLAAGPAARGLAPGLQSPGIDLTEEKEVRHGLPTACDALGHPLPDRADLQGRSPVAVRALEIGGQHGAVRARARHRVELDAVLAREPARLRRSESPARLRTRLRLGGGFRRLRLRRSWRRADRSRLRRCGDRSRLRRRLARRQDEGHGLADWHVVSFSRAEPSQDPLCRSLDLDRHLVRLHLEQGLALGDALALRLQPAEHLAGFLGQAEGGHDHLGRHD